MCRLVFVGCWNSDLIFLSICYLSVWDVVYVFLCCVTLHCWGFLLVFFLGTGMLGPISISTAIFVHKWCCSFQVFGPFDDRNQGNSSNRTRCCYLLLFPCSIWLCDCTLWLFKYNAYAFLLFWFWFLCCLTSFSLFCFVFFWRILILLQDVFLSRIS